MHAWRLVAGFLLLVPFVGCQNDRAKKAVAAAASAQALVASAQAIASAAETEGATIITGSMHSVGGELGTFDVTLTSCQSGEYNGFYGADFYATGSDDLRLRYVHDEARGDIVKIAFPAKKGTVRVFDRDDKCKILEGGVQKTNFSTRTSKGQIRHVNGHVKFDCAYTPGAGHVTGDVTFSHCH